MYPPTTVCAASYTAFTEWFDFAKSLYATAKCRSRGDALREIRKEHGGSQERLALDSGLDRTYVSLIGRGVQSPTLRTVAKLAGTLGVKCSDIVVRMETLERRARKG